MATSGLLDFVGFVARQAPRATRVLLALEESRGKPDPKVQRDPREKLVHRVQLASKVSQGPRDLLEALGNMVHQGLLVPAVCKAQLVHKAKGVSVGRWVSLDLEVWQGRKEPMVESDLMEAEGGVETQVKRVIKGHLVLLDLRVFRAKSASMVCVGRKARQDLLACKENVDTSVSQEGKEHQVHQVQADLLGVKGCEVVMVM